MARIVHDVLTAATVATVNLDEDYGFIEVMNRGGVAEIYFTVDGSTPTVGGANCEVLPAAISALEVAVGGLGDTVVKLISSGTDGYSVRGIS